jgi:hypothetical protein
MTPIKKINLGLCGQPRILDVGGVPYLIPLVQKEKLYEMKDFSKLIDFDQASNQSAFIIGAGAAPWTFINRNAEVNHARR